MTPALQSFFGLARALGVAGEVTADLPADADSVVNGGRRARAMVIDAGRLGECERNADTNVLLEAVSRGFPLLVLATGAGPVMDEALDRLTRGSVKGAVEIGHADEVTFPEGGAGSLGPTSGVLAGYRYARKPGPALGLTLNPELESEVVMRVDKWPAFVRVGGPQSRLFVWAVPEVFDVDRSLWAELEFEEALDGYVPGMVFLRAACGDRCWHNPAVGAGLVIDDPLLKPKYGLLDFERLLGSARRHKYHATLAFIPWNHRRTKPRRARWFLEHADCFSICAHGCDHTRNEFSSNDYDDLLQRNFTARTRMEAHTARTGIPCEPLMVCPQEQYSLEGIRAFADSRQFLALVNTGCIPRRMTEAMVTGVDLLRPAQDAFFGFPVFKRHYWSDMAPFAMAVFLGKPAILVEHHEFFDGGPMGVEDFVTKLRALAPVVHWASLVDVTTQTRWQRAIRAGVVEVRFFTTEFVLEHVNSSATEYIFRKRLPDEVEVQYVTINGHEMPVLREGGDLTFSYSAEHQQVLRIKVSIAPLLPKIPKPKNLLYKTSVLGRRMLSEFRDSVIIRNDFLFNSGRSIMKLLRQTGGSG